MVLLEDVVVDVDTTAAFKVVDVVVGLTVVVVVDVVVVGLKVVVVEIVVVVVGFKVVVVIGNIVVVTAATVVFVVDDEATLIPTAGIVVVDIGVDKLASVDSGSVVVLDSIGVVAGRASISDSF